MAIGGEDESMTYETMAKLLEAARPRACVHGPNTGDICQRCFFDAIDAHVRAVVEEMRPTVVAEAVADGSIF